MKENVISRSSTSYIVVVSRYVAYEAGVCQMREESPVVKVSELDCIFASATEVQRARAGQIVYAW